jgi:methyl coenzyme M reductase subunit C-like uncharacterized protein (methanogenesis marker protein 7)
VSTAVDRTIGKRRMEIDEDPLFVHPSELKERLEEIEAVRDSLRPAPIVLHLDGLRVKVPFEEYGKQIADLEVYGRKLGDIARITGSRMVGSTLIRIMTECEVKSRDALRH